MMTASPVSQGHASSKYYQAEGYYKAGSDEAKEAAQWFGKGAEDLGHKGEINEAAFASILEGDHPSGETLRRMKDDQNQHRAGVDLTFSAPKSVSIMALVGGDKRLIEAHDKAVRTALTWVEENTFHSRRYDENRNPIVEKADGMIAGVYRHDLSRALDPQLHSHAVVANMARSPDGKLRAVHNDAMFQNARLITGIYRAELAGEMQKLGYELRDGKFGAPEIAGITQEQMDAFSKRSQQVQAMLDDRKVEHSAQTARLATLLTRARKNTSVDRAEVYAAHRDEARSVGLTDKRFEKLMSGSIAREASFSALWEAPTADRAVAAASEHLAERDAVFTLDKLRVEALRFGKGLSIGEIDTAIANGLDKGALMRNGAQFTTSDALAAERLLLSKLSDMQKGTAPVTGETIVKAEGRKRSFQTAVNRKLDGTTLTDGQKDALRTSLLASERIVGVQGYAGTGKTYMVDTLRRYAEATGQTLEGLAPSHRSVDELSSAIPGSGTVQSAILKPVQAGDGKGKILVVDEASMLSTKDMTTLLTRAETARYDRVVLIGDMKQLDSVTAGAAFAQLQRSGLKVAVMDDIQRQRNEAALSTVNHAIAGEVADALGKISTVKETGEVAKTLAGQFLALSESDRETAGIATLSQSMRRAVNAAMRDGLKEEGKLGADLAERETLRNLNLTAAEKRSVESYSIGDVVVAHRDVKSAGLVSGERYVVTGADTATGTLALSGDSDSSKSASLKLDAKTKAVNAFAVYERESIALAAGDKVRIGTTDTERGFKTGDVATVIAADAQATTLRTKDGSDHELKREDLAGQTLTHAYASTVHDLQGATLDRLMFGMDARSPLATQKAFYVAVSRVRDDVTLVTDNKDGLRARLEEQTGAKESALDLISDTKEEDRRSREDLQVGRTERDHIEELMEELKAERTGRHQGLSPEEMSDRLKARNDALRAFTEGLKGETSMRDARETASEIIKDHQDASGDQDALKDLEEMIRNHGKDRGMEL